MSTMIPSSAEAIGWWPESKWTPDDLKCSIIDNGTECIKVNIIENFTMLEFASKISSTDGYMNIPLIYYNSSLYIGLIMDDRHNIIIPLDRNLTIDDCDILIPIKSHENGILHVSIEFLVICNERSGFKDFNHTKAETGNIIFIALLLWAQDNAYTLIKVAEHPCFDRIISLTILNNPNVFNSPTFFRLIHIGGQKNQICLNTRLDSVEDIYIALFEPIWVGEKHG